MESHILLINADAAGTETLKNLVLPGVGCFTILDSHIVNNRDLGNNFFVTEDTVGEYRAQVACKLFCEMNPDVQGHFRTDHVSQVLKSDPTYFLKFSLVIASNVPEAVLRELAFQLTLTPLVVVRVCGLIAEVRLQYPELEVVESHVEKDLVDLRIANPFPDLEEFVQTYDLDEITDSMEFAHIPFVVLLVKGAQRWRKDHAGLMPITASDKAAFRKSIEPIVPVKLLPLNVVEAQKEAHRAFAAKAIPEELEELLCSAETLTLSSSSSEFRILLRAVVDFRNLPENPSRLLPLGGQVPDMTASSVSFVKLQQAYRKKSVEDRLQLLALADKVLLQLGRSAGSISAETLDVFVKNLYSLRLCRTAALCALPENPGSIRGIFAEEAYDDPQQTPLLWHYALTASDKFFGKHGRHPGASGTSSALDADVQLVWKELETIADLLGQPAVDQSPLFTVDFAKEVVRFSDSQPHSIAALIGGVAAQETVKLITRQYVPINNTFVFNGIAGCGAVYQL